MGLIKYFYTIVYKERHTQSLTIVKSCASIKAELYIPENYEIKYIEPDTIIATVAGTNIRDALSTFWWLYDQLKENVGGEVE